MAVLEGATVRWQTEDLGAALESQGIEPTNENMADMVDFVEANYGGFDRVLREKCIEAGIDWLWQMAGEFAEEEGK